MESVQVTTFVEYQKAAMRTMAGNANNLAYVLLEIVSEIGEVNGKIAKVIRDNEGKLDEERSLGILGELGDVMWGVAGLCHLLKTDFDLPMYPKIADLDGEVKRGAKDFKALDIERIGLVLSREAGVLAQDTLTNGDVSDSIVRITRAVALAAGKIGYSMQEACQHNIDKLADRFNRNQIHGSGDNR